MKTWYTPTGKYWAVSGWNCVDGELMGKSDCHRDGNPLTVPFHIWLYPSTFNLLWGESLKGALESQDKTLRDIKLLWRPCSKKGQILKEKLNGTTFSLWVCAGTLPTRLYFIKQESLREHCARRNDHGIQRLDAMSSILAKPRVN
jgi:hypothetical protein